MTDNLGGGAGRLPDAATRKPHGGVRRRPARSQRLSWPGPDAVDPGLAHRQLVVRKHEVRAQARRDPAHLALEPEEFRGVGARHAHCLRQRHAEHLRRHCAPRPPCPYREPARLPSASTQAAPSTEIERPCRLNLFCDAPTEGIASVTSMNRSRRLQRSAMRSTAGSTCWPSTMIPHQLSWSSSAAPTAPGLAAGQLRHGVEEVRESRRGRASAPRAISS